MNDVVMVFKKRGQEHGRSLRCVILILILLLMYIFSSNS